MVEISSPQSLPLVLDLDGTLLLTDTFHEMVVWLLLHQPWTLFKLPFWFLRGRAFAKAQLAERVSLPLESLPYNQQLLAFAKEERQKGRSLILATGTDQRVAQKIAEYFPIFDEVIGSDGAINLTGRSKQEALVERFGREGFDYAGDSRADKWVWKMARKAIVVRPKWGVLKEAYRIRGGEHTAHFPRQKTRFLAFLLALRPLFWGCNLGLASLPLMVAFSLLASGLLIGGDLLNLYKERKGHDKQSVFAEGHLHLTTALLFFSLLAGSGLATLCILLPWGGLFALAYIPLFMGLDMLTRPMVSPDFRWAFLVFFQFCVTLLVKAL